VLVSYLRLLEGQMIMRQFLCVEKRRRAATMPLFALLLVPLLGMLAFSIDIGWIALVREDLQAAADAAALAGAEKLQELYVQYTLPNQTSQNTIFTTATTNTPGSPMDTAEKFAAYNRAGNVSITMPDADVSFCFMDAQGNFFKNYKGLGLGGGFPNSITVIARRDRFANSPLSLFFGPVFGFYSTELTATATATIYSGDVNMLRAIPGVKAHILPVALDMNIWQTFYQTGLSSDGSMHFAANGYPELHVYPCPGNAPGSFGLLDVGLPQNNMPAFTNWIDNGETPNDINYLINNNLVPVSVTSPQNWKCGPGMKSSLLGAFQAEMGKPNLLPLFMPAAAPSPWQALSAGPYQAASGTGQNVTYAIVGFVGVTISQAEANGTNMDISIQPYAVVDPTAVISNPFSAKPANAQQSQFSSAIITTFISAKLTQ
jgi:Putative Flp pilus-assembly TadE/G-like